MANLSSQKANDGKILWAHVVLAFILFPVAVFLMRRFSVGLKMKDTIYRVTRTLAIQNIPQLLCTVKDLKQHFSEAYPNVLIQDIQVNHTFNSLNADKCFKGGF